MVDYYKMLFKRKSFHLFRGACEISMNEGTGLETHLNHDGYEFTDVQYPECAAREEERILAAEYRLHRK